MAKELSPMLAPNKTPPLEDLEYPLLASAKLDGMRCIVKEGGIFTRAMKEIPNKHVHQQLERCKQFTLDQGVVLDGEIYSHECKFQDIISCLRSFENPMPPGLMLCLIDQLTNEEWKDPTISVPFWDRYTKMSNTHLQRDLMVKVIKQFHVYSPEDVTTLFDHFVDMGYEGLMLRDPLSKYRHGRATVKQGIIYKYKAWREYDGQIIEVIEKKEMKEGIARIRDAMGNLESSNKKDDYQLAGTLGALRIRLEDGTEVKIGTWIGLTDEERQRIWNERDSVINSWVRFRGQAVGVKDKPRMPHNLEFRDDK